MNCEIRDHSATAAIVVVPEGKAAQSIELFLHAGKMARGVCKTSADAAH